MAPKKPKRHNLTRPQHVRAFLAHIINKCHRGEIDANMLRALSYGCQCLMSAMEQTTLDERLEVIQEKLGIQ